MSCPNPISQEELLKYTKAKSENLTRKEIAKKFNVSESRVISALKTRCLNRLNIRQKLAEKEPEKNETDLIVSASKLIEQELSKGAVSSLFTPEDLYIKDYSKNKEKEIAVLHLTDIHIGKKNQVLNFEINKLEETYNFKIFQTEIRKLRKAIQTVVNLLGNTYQFEKLVIFITGDIVDNDRIYKGQQLNIDLSVGNQIFEGLGILSQFIVSLKSRFPKIEVYCVPGNHGRTTSERTDEPATSSFDYILYKVLQLIFQKDSQIKINVSDDYIYLARIYDFNYLLLHGNNIPSWSSIPFYGMARAGLQYFASIAPISKLDLIISGHIHQCLDLPLTEQLSWLTSSGWVPKDKFAFSVFKTYPRTVQRFFGVNPKHSMTWNFKLDLQTGKHFGG